MIIGFLGNKGGIGKSTLSVHTAYWLYEQGRKVALIDSDPQGASTRWLNGLEPKLNTYKLTTSDDLIETVHQLDEDYEYVIIDGVPGLSDVTRSTMLICDKAILPCGPSQLDLIAAFDAVRILGQAQQITGGKPSALLVPNRLQARYRLSKELISALANMDVPVVKGLGHRQHFADAPGQSTVVWKMQNADKATTEILDTMNLIIRSDESENSLRQLVNQ